MRRIIVLLVLALVGATAYGATSTSSAVDVNGQRVTNNAFTNELNAISSNPTLRCYIEALGGQAFAAGAGSHTITSGSSAVWANMRVQGLAIGDYVKKYFKYSPNAAALAQAKSSLEGEMTSTATSAGLQCPGTSVQALAAMPAEMRTTEILDQAMSTYFVSRLDRTIPLTLSSIKTYYSQHTSRYDTLCVSIALVAPSNLNAFSAAQAKGASVSQLAKLYSSDPSGRNGGAYGCYPPTNSSFASVRADAGTTPLNTFPKQYQVINYNGGQYALYVAVTKRTPTTFSAAASAVLSDIQALNATNARNQQQVILFHAAVSINPAFGQWGLASNGPSVFATSKPPTDRK
ncbi:MAG: hypothetical protein HIU84_10855, partial [Acidobacteria bacterium]|nr:hypothetical protein [Acidobacteriota bacterium]